VTLAARRHGRPQLARLTQIPAPTGGLNRIDPVAALPPGDCTLLSNLVAAEFGLRSRLGFHEWVTNLTGTIDNTVRTIMPFGGSKQNHSTDRVFATTDKGIWDVTASTQAPAAPAGVTAFGTVNADSGRGSSVVAVDNTGAHNLIYCDEANGYFVYREATADWVKVAQGAGATQVAAPADPTQFVQVCLYASRLWFVQKDSTKAWYLGVFGGPAIYGTANQFDFGPYFRGGGTLIGLYNWTIDGGSGVINRLVAVSTSGDIVIFQGIDPSLAVQWSLVGIWNVGNMPAGRNIATTFGGDLLVLSTIGVIPLSRLVIGNPIVDRTQYATYKITNLFNFLMYSFSAQKGWSIRLNPQDNTFMITVPATGGKTQLVMALTNRSWTQYTGLDINCNEILNGVMYFGTTDGRVCQHTDYIDGVLLSNPNAFTPITCQLLTAFQSLGTPIKKVLQIIRPRFLAQGITPNVAIAAKYDFDLSVPAAPTGQALASGSAVWDTAVWDTALWQADYVASESLAGGQGMGVYAAVAIAFQAVARTILVGFDLSIESGGLM